MASPLALPSAEISLFHDPTGTAYADIAIDGHRETWPIRSRQFRHWLRRRHYEETGGAASPVMIGSAVDLLEARAQFDAPERNVHVRVAENDGHIYLDLADKDRRAVEIGPNGWSVVTSPPVRFRRAAGMLALPLPQRGGEALAALLNLPGPDGFVLVVAWPWATVRPVGPYPLLVIDGEQRSAKAMLTKILRALIDPNVAAARALPREERDLMIAANNGHVLAFDNISGLPTWLSDALCRLASGGSFGIRQLYTDANEILFQRDETSDPQRHRNIVGRPDLADRAIFLTLESISDRRRRPEKELWQKFETHGHGSSVPSSMQRFMGCAAYPAFTSATCRVWRTSRFGQQRVKRAFGRLVHSCAPMTQTDGARSMVSSRQTPWLLLCGKSWRNAPHGQEEPRIFCARVLLPAMCLKELRGGRKIRVP